ncbi:hypothetical protein HDU83_005953 [Entophlyctis luteolus]|nr:hypothetical protein HDU83_005953 [Entophlyctis luteolus]
MWEIILFGLAVLFPLLFILLLCLLWRRRERRQQAAENYRRYADQSNIPLISKYSEPPSPTRLFETSTGLVPGTYAAASVHGATAENPSSQQQHSDLQMNSGAFLGRYDFDSSVDSATGAVIAGAAAAYATLAGNTSGSDDSSIDFSTRRTPDDFVSQPPIQLSNSFITTYDSTMTSSPAQRDNLYSVGTGALKPSADLNYSIGKSNLSDSTASVTVAIESEKVERKDDLNMGLIAAGTAVAAGAAVIAAETAPKKTRKFKAQFAKKKYSVEPSEVAAELGPQFFEPGTTSAVSNVVANSTYLPTVTETVTTTTTTTQQGFETKTVVQLKPSYIGTTDSLSTIEVPGQTIAVQKTGVALDRARRFLYACQSSYGGKFDIRTFEIMALFAKPQFEITVMFEFLLEFALTGQEITAAVISESFYVSVSTISLAGSLFNILLQKANLELPARRQLHLLIALVGANETAVISIFTDLLSCLVEIESVPIFLGALYPLSPAPSLPDSHIISVMELFLVRRVSLTSETARFDLTSFVAHVRRDNRRMSPPFHISSVLKSIAQSVDPVYTPSAFRATLHACGVDCSSLAVFNGYLVTLCGSVDDAAAVLALFARAVRLVGVSLFLRAIGEEQQSVEVRAVKDESFEEFWERIPSTVDSQSKTRGNAALLKGVRFKDN